MAVSRDQNVNKPYSDPDVEIKQEDDELEEQEVATYLLSVYGRRNEVDQEMTSSAPLQSSDHALSPPPSNPHNCSGTSARSPVCGCKKKAYVIFHGRRTGVFRTWEETYTHVHRFSHARYRGYHSVADAQRAYEEALSCGQVGPASTQGANNLHTTPRCMPCGEVQPEPKPTNGPFTPPPPYSGGRRPENSPRDENPTATRPITRSCTPRVSPLAGGTPRASFPSDVTYALDSGDSEEANWWVVSVGDRPGVYHGRTAAREHAGNSVDVEMYECDGLEEAQQTFVDLFASRQIRRLLDNDHAKFHLSHFMATSSVINDMFWYVVPMGPNSGVYEGRRTAYRMAGPATEFILRCESERAAYALFVDLYMTMGIQEN